MPQIGGIVAGTYTGTGAAQTVTLGFKPKAVFMYNQTDGDFFGGHIEGMTDATAFAITTATAAVASQGITLTSRGFTLGTDAGANENAKVYLYVAFP